MLEMKHFDSDIYKKGFNDSLISVFLEILLLVNIFYIHIESAKFLSDIIALLQLIFKS